jgi:hypothetical protein
LEQLIERTTLGQKRTLHIVNGDSLAQKINDSRIHGDILVWREALYEGPLFQDLSTDEARNQRADYMAQRGIVKEDFIKALLFQEGVLADFKQYDEIVLWFEYDLFDQLILIFLLAWFAKQNLEHTSLSLISINSFPKVVPFFGFGQLSIPQLETLISTWEPVTEEQKQLAVMAWKAFTSSNPTELIGLLKGNLAPLPFLKDALLCHLRKFPSVKNGLSQVQQRTLEQLVEGKKDFITLFNDIMNYIPEYGIGDSQYLNCLGNLEEETPMIKTGRKLPFLKRQYTLTTLGNAVLNHKSDCIEIKGINTWIGGIRLLGKEQIWRWDEEQKELILS